MLRILCVAAFFWALFGAASAQAAIFRIEAASHVVAYSDFVIEFDDLDGDTTFSSNELTFFSGVFFFPATENRLLDVLVRFEPLEGISDDRGSGIFFMTSDFLLSAVATTSAFTFELSAVGEDPVTTVPLPPAAWLYLAGLCGIGYLRRAIWRRHPT